MPTAKELTQAIENAARALNRVCVLLVQLGREETAKRAHAKAAEFLELLPRDP